MEVITLNLIPGGATQVVHASQFDKGRQFKLITYMGDEPFNPSTYDAQFESIKPDGNIVQADVVKDSTSVTVTTTEQMCAVEGDTICEIRFSKSGNVIGSANFILRVELDPIFKGTNSKSEGQIYDTLVWLTENKENWLVAGNNIQINRQGGNNPRTTVSATDTTYTAGNHISISGQNNTISATYVAGSGITITNDTIADIPYTAGTGIAISANREISTNVSTLPIASASTLGCIKVGANLGIDPDGTLSASGGSGGGDYLAGDNIQISAARRISATDTTYTAGYGIDITGASNEISVDTSDLSHELAITIPTSAWNPTTHMATLPVTGVTTTSHQDILPVVVVNDTNVVNNLKLQAANIMDAGQSTGSITLYAQNIPTDSLSIRVLIHP